MAGVAAVGGEAGRSTRRRFAGNAAWLVVGQAVAKLGGFVYVVIVTRSLGPLDYGSFNFALSFVPLFLIFSVWGLDIAVIRGVARHPERVSEVVASGLVLRIALGLLALALAVATAPLLVDGAEPLLTVVLLGVALLLDEITSFLGSVFKAYERMAAHSIVIIVNRVASLVLALGVVVGGGGLLAVSATYLLGSLGALALAVVVLRRRFPPIDLHQASRSTLRRFLREGTPLALAAGMSMALFRIDTVLLQAIQGTREVGLYGIAYLFFESFLFVTWSLAVVTMPRMARAGRSAVSGRAFNLTLALVLAFYLPLAAGSPFAADWVVSTLFGDRYAEAATAVVWLTAAAAAYGVAHLARLGAMALGERHRIAWVAGIALVVNVGVNLVVIPRFGFQGAAAVTCLTELLEMGLLLATFGGANAGLRLERVVAVPIVAAAVMVAVMAATGVRDATAVVVGTVVYAAALSGFGLLLAPAESRRVVDLVRRRPAPAPTSSP